MTEPRGIIIVVSDRGMQEQAQFLLERLERDMKLTPGSTIITLQDAQTIAELREACQKPGQTHLLAEIPEHVVKAVTEMANSLFLVNRWAVEEPPLLSGAAFKQKSDGRFSLPKVKNTQKPGLKSGGGRKNDARLLAPRLRRLIP